MLCAQFLYQSGQKHVPNVDGYFHHDIIEGNYLSGIRLIDSDSFYMSNVRVGFNGGAEYNAGMIVDPSCSDLKLEGLMFFANARIGLLISGAQDIMINNSMFVSNGVLQEDDGTGLYLSGSWRRIQINGNKFHNSNSWTYSEFVDFTEQTKTNPQDYGIRIYDGDTATGNVLMVTNNQAKGNNIDGILNGSTVSVVFEHNQE